MLLHPDGESSYYGVYSTPLLIFAALQFVAITRYYASLRLAGNKNPRTLNPIQLKFLGLTDKISCTG
jgi:hypothetical protein